MIQDIVAAARRGNRDFKILLHLLLTDVFVEAPRSQVDVIVCVVLDQLGRDRSLHRGLGDVVKLRHCEC